MRCVCAVLLLKPLRPPDPTADPPALRAASRGRPPSLPPSLRGEGGETILRDASSPPPESLLSVSNQRLLRSSSASESRTGEYRKYRKPKIFPCQRFIHSRKRDRGVRNLSASRPVPTGGSSLSLSVRPSVRPSSFPSPSPGLCCCTTGGQAAGGGRGGRGSGGAVRMPCPALSSSG